MTDIEKYDIKLYEFPECDSDDDDEFKKSDEEIKVSDISELYIFKFTL